MSRDNSGRNEAITELAAMGLHEHEIAGALDLTAAQVHGVITRWKTGVRRKVRLALPTMTCGKARDIERVLLPLGEMLR